MTGSPPFLLVEEIARPAAGECRFAEVVTLAWLHAKDSGVLGLRIIHEERAGVLTPVVHVAIPQEYSRAGLAEKLGIPGIGTSAKRVNLAPSGQIRQPHAYLRIPAEVLVERLAAVFEEVRHDLLEERDDRTVSLSPREVEEFVRTQLHGEGRWEADAPLHAQFLAALKARGVQVPSRLHDAFEVFANGDQVRLVIPKGVRTGILRLFDREGIVYQKSTRPGADPAGEMVIECLRQAIERLRFDTPRE